MKAITYLLLSSLLVSFQSNAIIMRHDKDSKLYQISDAQYPSIINLAFLMGTLIDKQWIITAAHGTPLMPGGQKILINNQQFTIDKIIPHPNYDPVGKSLENQQNHDIALLKLDRPVIGIKPAIIYSGQSEQSQLIWLAGRGYVGNGIHGITGAAASLYQAQNIVDTANEHWITFDFDHPDSGAVELEGVSAPGDSGGPAFIRIGSQLQLAGVSSHQLDNESGQPNLYGVTERYTRISQYTDWINKTLNLSKEQLNKVALNRRVYEPIAASATEFTELAGQYSVENLPPFIIEKCQQTLCYRWEGQPRTTEIFKADDDLWFTDKINRTIKIVRNKHGEIEKLSFQGYQGGIQAIKI